MQALEHSGYRRIQRRHQAFSRSCCSAHHSGSPYCNRTRKAPQQMLEWRGGSVASLFGLNLINWRSRDRAPSGNASTECGSPFRSTSGVIPPAEPPGTFVRVCTEENCRCVSYYCVDGVNQDHNGTFQGGSGA
jgi:hypothetical protein